MNTPFSEDIEAAREAARYDQACKRIISYKPILAHILKSCVDEFKDSTLYDIEHKYIEGEPEVTSEPMHPDQSMRIIGENNEDPSVNEHTVLYDIKFRATVPDGDSEIGLIINVEAQNKYNPGYPLIKRGLYYVARMISAQYGTVFVGSQYEKIRKVYSIWLCMNAPKERQSSISTYDIRENIIIGNSKEDKRNYDLMKVVMVCLGKENESESSLLRMLNTLFSDTMGVSTRKQILSDEYGIAMSGSVSEEVEYMCNLSIGVFERGHELGMEQGHALGMEQGHALGMEQGHALGMEQGRYVVNLESLRNVIEGLHMSFDKAADLLKIPESEREKYKTALGLEK